MSCKKHFTEMPEQSWKLWPCHTSQKVNACLNPVLKYPYCFFFWNQPGFCCLDLLHAILQQRQSDFLPLYMSEIWITFHKYNRFNFYPSVPASEKELRRHLNDLNWACKFASTMETWLRRDCIQGGLCQCTCKGTNIYGINLVILFLGLLPAVL